MGETCNLVRYVNLSNSLKKMGYIVVHINPDWEKPLTEQIFKVEKDAIVFGFSMGAVLAYLSAEKYPCKKLIVASISPVHTFKYRSFQKFLSEHMSREKSINASEDILAIKIDLESLKTPHVSLMGQKEELSKREKTADISIPKANHYVGKAYAEAILKLL